jgi:hypothetical protein
MGRRLAEGNDEGEKLEVMNLGEENRLMEAAGTGAGAPSGRGG